MTDRPERTPAMGPIDTRITIAALWTAVLFVFAYVDLFSLEPASDLGGYAQASSGYLAVWSRSLFWHQTTGQPGVICAWQH